MKTTQKVVSTQRLNEWLKDRLQHESRHTIPPFTEDTVSYLVNLLVYFSQSQNFFTRSEHGITFPSLAFLYRDASQAKTTTSKLITLRRLGDSALFIGAMFPEKLGRVGIKKDYYIGMGGGAYSALADYNYGNPEVFSELSARFPKFLQVTARVCTREVQFDAEEIFMLYERWRSSRDELLKRQLMSVGISTFDEDRIH
ncbi:hypothetical protein [Methylophaga sp. OBS4]|uniref:hypothetical protein n=1 Tax=Methylophaga sp. OBS4 TaxID=2991935 RepID=UPI00225ADC60|nr:hypothetical protein [Methylophaga sp. OBS4]MCX4187039.1 hypothetical protein [Methylophaga sp. OBS4]